MWLEACQEDSDSESCAELPQRNGTEDQLDDPRDVSSPHNSTPFRPSSFEAIREELRCVPRILRALNGRLNRPLSEEDVADLSQEVLFVVWRKLRGLELRTSLEGWVYRISFLEMMNHLRKKRRTRLVAGVDLEDTEATLEPTSPLAERFEELHLGLELLEEDEAAIIRLKHYEELAFPEVAESLDLPLGTVKTRYYRGLTKLKEFFENRDQEVRRGSLSNA